MSIHTTDLQLPEGALSPEQRELARHALGLPHHSKQSWRNHFVTGPGSNDHPHWMKMVAAGLARRRNGSKLPFGGDDLFHLTKAGAKQALNRGESLDPEDFPIIDAAGGSNGE